MKGIKLEIKDLQDELPWLFAISAIWGILILIVNPIGEFPINDDWAYAFSVRELLETGDFQFSDWTATNLLTQVLWGTLFCLPFGFSFTALRFSTLTLGLAGILATYGLLREVNLSRPLSFFAALVVALNPIYFSLAHSFMNDVPFFGFAIVALYFLVRGLRQDSSFDCIIGILVSYVALLSRQLGLILPFGFGIAYILKKGLSLRTVVVGFAPTALGVIIQLTYQFWLEITLRAPAKYGNQINTLVQEVSQGLRNTAINFTTIALYALVYLGVFLFPFLLLSLVTRLKNLSLQHRIFSLSVLSTIIFIVLSTLISKQRLMPLHGNILVDLGVGVHILKDSEWAKAPPFFWMMITAIGVIGATLLVHNFCLAISIILSNYYNFRSSFYLPILILSLTITVVYL
ncbi:hypothetical protein C7B61_22425, partial [filamentous cyanobacterium CCP1]